MTELNEQGRLAAADAAYAKWLEPHSETTWLHVGEAAIRAYLASTPLSPEVADLLERLKAMRLKGSLEDGIAIDDAIARLEAQQAEIASLSSRLAEVERLAAERGEALRPFADFGEFMEVETEGFSDTDRLYLIPEESEVRLGDLFVSAFRRAREALGDSHG